MAQPDPSRSDSRTSTGIWSHIRGAWSAARGRWWIRWAMDLGFFALIFFAITSYQTRNLVESGNQVPALSLESADGDRSPLVAPETDRTLVYVWAPWCSVCSAASGTVEWARSILGDEVAVRTVVYDVRSGDHAAASADEKGIDAPVLLADRRFQQTFQVDAFPTFYVLSDERRVVSSAQGYTTTLGLIGRAWF